MIWSAGEAVSSCQLEGTKYINTHDMGSFAPGLTMHCPVRRRPPLLAQFIQAVYGFGVDPKLRLGIPGASFERIIWPQPVPVRKQSGPAARRHAVAEVQLRGRARWRSPGVLQKLRPPLGCSCFDPRWCPPGEPPSLLLLGSPQLGLHGNDVRIVNNLGNALDPDRTPFSRLSEMETA